MRGMMMEVPLMISELIRYADDYHGDGEAKGHLLDCERHLGAKVTRDDMLAYLESKIASWWSPLPAPKRLMSTQYVF